MIQYDYSNICSPGWFNPQLGSYRWSYDPLEVGILYNLTQF